MQHDKNDWGKYDFLIKYARVDIFKVLDLGFLNLPQATGVVKTHSMWRLE